MNCAVIIPAYNEERHIERVVRGVLKHKCTAIVVDDGSKDRTAHIATSAGAVVLKHKVNLGKGGAARTGCEYALKEGYEELVLMDADGQHRPEDLPRMIRALRTKEVVFGYREYDHHMPLLMRFGNELINVTSRIINGVWLNDTQSGYRAMKANTYRKIRWDSTDYGMESEMIARIAKQRISYTQIPIPNIYEEKYKGTGIFDGIKILVNMLRWRIIN